MFFGYNGSCRFKHYPDLIFAVIIGSGMYRWAMGKGFPISMEIPTEFAKGRRGARRRVDVDIPKVPTMDAEST